MLLTDVYSITRYSHIVWRQIKAPVSVPLISYPACYKILLAVFWQKIFYIRMGFYQKFLFKLNMVNFCMWTNVKLSWFATCHIYDVIKQLSK